MLCGGRVADTPLVPSPLPLYPCPKSFFDRIVDDLADRLRREVPADVRVAFVGEAPPESFVAVGAQGRGGEVLRGVGDQSLLAVAQGHALRADGGRDDGQAVGERLADLALDARAEAYGRDEDARAREDRADVRHVAEQAHPPR